LRFFKSSGAAISTSIWLAPIEGQLAVTELGFDNVDLLWGHASSV